MAYVALSDLGGAGPAPVVPGVDRVPARDGCLSALEWRVVAIARGDGRASLRRPGRWSAVLRAIANRPNPRLADARLEALRRMAVLLWRDGAASACERRAFLDAGFTPEQCATVGRGIDAARLAPGRSASPR